MAKGRKTGGRVAGTPNKATADVQARCRELIESPSYQTSFRTRFEAGTLAPALETMAWHYAYGKPSETVQIGGQVTIQWQT